MESLIEMRKEDNYRDLIKAGLDAAYARIISQIMKARVILEVAISDIGVHLGYWDSQSKAERTIVLKFEA